MLKLSELEIIELINAGEIFECEISDGSFAIKIESYTPTVCTAIHAGHRLRSKLIPICNLSEEERLYEEDPFTDQFIQAMPITLIANDSRYEYDLNRPLSTCIYSFAWGKHVWSKKISEKERKVSIEKHQCFYRVLDALTRYLQMKFGSVMIYDIHSYNYMRWETATPTFNLGTEQLDLSRWDNIVDYAQRQLQNIELPNMPVDAAINQVFYGRGYLAAHINSRFDKVLVLPLEIKKVFMDELKGEVYPLVMQSLSQQIKDCFVNISALFTRRFTSKQRVTKLDVLAEKLDPAIVKVDRSLYKLAKDLETLVYINPINIQAEKKLFFKSHGSYQPQFRYRQLDVDPYHFREQLYRLPVDGIRDPSIQHLYRDVINSLSEKIGMLVKAGQPDFLYESLKYYGEPSFSDEKNARFLLHATDFDKEVRSHLSSEELFRRFEESAKAWDMACKIETSSKLVASAMVSNSRKAVMIAKGLTLPELEASALIHHELGVHMATTLNADKQRLKVFSIGLPGNTLTQEGLAILNEYQSGNMSLGRLKGLALRVLAVKEMLKQNDFRHTFSYLFEEQHMSQNEAFKLAVRVHRGGGFTKDYLYLNGVSQALYLSRQQDIRNLYIGKTGFNYLSVINEMVERQLAQAPIYYPEYLHKPVKTSPVLDYLINCIQDSKATIHHTSQRRESAA